MLGLAGDRRLNALLELAMTELHQRVVVEPDPRNVAILRGLNQRTGRRAEFLALCHQDEALQLVGKIEFGVELVFDLRLEVVGQEMHQQPDRQLPGLEPDIALMVLIDEVVLARHPG